MTVERLEVKTTRSPPVPVTKWQMYISYTVENTQIGPEPSQIMISTIFSEAYFARVIL